MQMAVPKTEQAESPTRLLAEFASGLGHGDLDEAAHHAVRRHTLDTVGAMIAGATQRATVIVEATLAETTGAGDVPVAGLARRMDALSAAYVMGTASHGLELDDGYRKGSVHPGCVVVPALLAAAHGSGVDGQTFVAAVAVGYEISSRIARSMHPRSRHRGFHNTSVAGVLAAAAAVGRLRGLHADRIGHALGLAGSSAAGVFAFLSGGGEVKRTHPGHAAREGLMVALFAERGLTGPAGVIEAEDGGIFSSFAGEGDFGDLLAGLGDEFAVADCYMKPFAACRHLHPGIDGMLQLREAHSIDPDDVVRIEIATYALAESHAATGWGDMLAAQMSYPYTMAAALAEGAVDLEQFTEAARADDTLTRHCAKVEVTVDDECEADYPVKRAAKLTVHMADGQSHQAYVPEPYGAPANPMSDQAVSRKFRGLADPVLGAERAARAEELLWRLDELDDLSDLTEALAAEAPAAE